MILFGGVKFRCGRTWGLAPTCLRPCIAHQDLTGGSSSVEHWATELRSLTKGQMESPDSIVQKNREKNMKFYGMLKCFQVLNGDMISSISFHFRERNFGPGPICTGRNLPLRARWFHSNGPRPNCPQLTAAMQQMSSLEQTNA